MNFLSKIKNQFIYHNRRKSSQMGFSFIEQGLSSATFKDILFRVDGFYKVTVHRTANIRKQEMFAKFVGLTKRYRSLLSMKALEPLL